ncbi:(2Fe-2S)-binding protein [Telmatospirillum sp. J64-1]|uniref:(2Fe-2S)-binding protein n=1 Tax=Telmatospirillum sp. J64-1 TaxID=2502183 RepID=UPI00115E8F1C|nr:(2Fe-2S)-binding protein [Telmatospirillum sp. J64-1]
MPTGPQFQRLPDQNRATVTLTVEGRTIEAKTGETVAAAILAAGLLSHTRTTPVLGAERAPYCMMGVCFECLMVIDGEPNRQACMTLVQDGMNVERQLGARTAPAPAQEVA